MPAKLIVSMNLSLDGFISAAGEDDGSWLRIDEEVHRAFNELAVGAGTFLYGRKVYEVMPPYWPAAADDATRPDFEREYGRLWVETPKVVVSTSLRESRWKTRVIEPGDLGEEVTVLKGESNRTVLCYGGSQLASALQRQGLVDEYHLFVHPSTLGDGQPFFRERVSLALVDVHPFGNGVLAVRYAPLGDRAGESR